MDVVLSQSHNGIVVVGDRERGGLHTLPANGAARRSLHCAKVKLIEYSTRQRDYNLHE
jgi:hypothetical protein